MSNSRLISKGDRVVFRERTAIVDRVRDGVAIIRCRSAGCTVGPYLSFRYRVPVSQLVSREVKR